MVGMVRAFSKFPSLDPCFQDPVSFCPIDSELNAGRFKIMTECQDCVVLEVPMEVLLPRQGLPQSLSCLVEPESWLRRKHARACA